MTFGYIAYIIWVLKKVELKRIKVWSLRELKFGHFAEKWYINWLKNIKSIICRKTEKIGEFFKHALVFGGGDYRIGNFIKSEWKG